VASGHPLAFRQGKVKDGTLPKLRLDRDAATVPFDDLLADSQSYSSAGELSPFM
jgi:hypothetical protein